MKLPLKRKIKIIAQWLWYTVSSVGIYIFNYPIFFIKSINIKKEELRKDLDVASERYEQELLDTPIELNTFYVNEDYNKTPSLLNTLNNQMNILAGLPPTRLTVEHYKQYLYVIKEIEYQPYGTMSYDLWLSYKPKHYYLCYVIIHPKLNGIGGYLERISSVDINKNFKKTEPFIYSKHNNTLNLTPSDNELDLAKMFREHPFRDPQEYQKEYENNNKNRGF